LLLLPVTLSDKQIINMPLLLPITILTEYRPLSITLHRTNSMVEQWLLWREKIMLLWRLMPSVIGIPNFVAQHHHHLCNRHHVADASPHISGGCNALRRRCRRRSATTMTGGLIAISVDYEIIEK
jgi:hypothetical protein